MNKTLLELCLEQGGKWKLPNRPDSYFEAFARGPVTCVREYVGEDRDPKGAEHTDLLRRDAEPLHERIYWDHGTGCLVKRDIYDEGSPLDMPDIERATAFHEFCKQVAPLFRHKGVGVVGDLELTFHRDEAKFYCHILPGGVIGPFAIRVNSQENANRLLEELNKDVD